MSSPTQFDDLIMCIFARCNNGSFVARILGFISLRFFSRNGRGALQPQTSDPTRSFRELTACRIVESQIPLRQVEPQAGKDLKEVGWTKGLKLAKVARRDEQEFDCATWPHNARSLPNDQFKREGEKEPLGRNQNRGKLSTASFIRMLGRAKSRGHVATPPQQRGSRNQAVLLLLKLPANLLQTDAQGDCGFPAERVETGAVEQFSGSAVRFARVKDEFPRKPH
jgi:hypothetical protein